MIDNNLKQSDLGLVAPIRAAFANTNQPHESPRRRNLVSELDYTETPIIKGFKFGS
jgi:hypothetical protein